MLLETIKDLLRPILSIYYRLRIALCKYLVGNEALSYVLYASLFPRVVLSIGGATVGKGTRIGRWLTLHEARGSFKNLVIGDYVHIGKFVLIDLSGKVTIGNRAGLSMFSRILTHQNLGDSQLSEEYPITTGDIEIPDDVVIASGAVIMYPTKLAEKTMVSAGSVVRGEYDKPCVLVGNPARPSIKIQEKEGGKK